MIAQTLVKKGGERKLAGHRTDGGAVRRFWAALYSPAQRAFHVSTVAEMLQSNRRQFVEGGVTDFVPLAIVASHAEASALLDILETRCGRPGTAMEAYEQRVNGLTNNG